MTGIWLLSYIILWALVLAGAGALLALARELVALQRELQMVKYQLAHMNKGAEVRSCEQVPGRCPRSKGDEA